MNGEKSVFSGISRTGCLRLLNWSNWLIRRGLDSQGRRYLGYFKCGAVKPSPIMVHCLTYIRQYRQWLSWGFRIRFGITITVQCGEGFEIDCHESGRE